MPTIQHNVLTAAELHEPKGASTASEGDTYTSDGAGSGSWVHPVAHFGGYISFDAATPAYQHSATTSDTVLNPVFTQTSANEFTAVSTPNARITYTGATTRSMFLMFNCSIKQASGGAKDVELIFYKNGVALDGSRVIRQANTGAWGSVSMHFDVELSTNDYLEVFVKGSAAMTVDFAQAYLGILAPTK